MKKDEGLGLNKFVRPFIYSLSVFLVFYILIIQQYRYSKEIYFLISFLGGILIFEESIFSVYYANSFKKRRLGYLMHGFNHTIYPQFFYIGLIVYSYLQKDYFLGFGLALASLLVYFFYFYLLPLHIRHDHSDSPLAEKDSAKVDFLIYLFKLLSYFSVNLALFELLRQGYINGWEIFVSNLAVNVIYLLAHLNRKYEVNKINLFMSLMFSIITSVFILNLRVPSTDYSASISTLVFYLTSSIFYHKVDGTFTYKVFIEYASIAAILSIFLFAS